MSDVGFNGGAQEGDHLPEPTGNNTLMAQETINFAFAFDELPEPIDNPSAAVELVEGAIIELQTLPEASSIAWRQGYWKQKPGHTLWGETEKHFPDGSVLHVMITQDLGEPPEPIPFINDNVLNISLRTSYPADQSRAVAVRYRIERYETALICETDASFGADILAVEAMVKKLDEMDPLNEADPMELLAGVFLEAEIMSEGLAPDIDPEVEELRDGSEVYRLISDNMRNDLANSQLEEDMGLATKRRVGPNEAHTLVALLRSL